MESQQLSQNSPISQRLYLKQTKTYSAKQYSRKLQSEISYAEIGEKV